MGGDEERTLAKPSKPKHSAQDIPTVPPYPDWSSSMQAYYGGGATPPFFATNVASHTPHPYMWGTQHAFIPPFGTPVPYPAMYPPAGVYAHPNITQAPSIVPTNMEIEGNALNGKDQALSKKLKASTTGEKAGSGSGHDQSGSEGSSDASDDDGNQGYTHKKGGLNHMSVDEDNSRSDPVGTNRQASSSVNIGMNLWNAKNTGDGTAKMRPNLSVHPQAPMVGGDGFMANQWIHDSHDLRKEKRKQSNRESARRSRLRKQAECEELQAKVDKLANENQTLKDELQRLSIECQKLASENNSIKEEIGKVNSPGTVSDSEINDANSS